MLSLQVAISSAKGRKHEVNQDFAAFKPEIGCFAIADGVGGHQAGEVASKIAAEQSLFWLEKYLKAYPQANIYSVQAKIKAILEDVNRSIYEAASENHAHAGMGSTVVLGCVRSNRMIYAWVGDSRLYLGRQHLLKQLSEDHTLKQHMINTASRSDDAANVPNNILLRALGAESIIQVETGSLEIEEGDLILATTDGVHDVLTAEQLESILFSKEMMSLQDISERIVRHAMKQSGRDDTTIIAMQLEALDGQ